MFKKIVIALLAAHAASALALPLSSRHALVVDEESGAVLFEKNADAVVSIASLTKLMTAMVVLDANPDMDELIPIDDPEVQIKKQKRPHSRLPVGAMLPRRAVLQLALIYSDNRAAASLANAYPGGIDGFVAAVQAKQEALGMSHTSIGEPTGLSAANRSTATDLAKMAEAAAQYPEIASITTENHNSVAVNGRTVEYRNTNRLVGQQGWDISLSKTGTTKAAGRCLIMRLQSAGRNVILVLLNAKAGSARLVDAWKIRRFVAGETAALHAKAAGRHTVQLAKVEQID